MIQSLRYNEHSHKICAPDKESLDNMIRELDEVGFLLKNHDKQLNKLK